MLNKSDTSIADTLLRFSNHGIDVGLLVPTDTAVEKSIIDAHHPFRAYLERNNIHHFAKQAQGEKRFIPATILDPAGNHTTKVSLYRPNTKNGDPRIWIYDLKKYFKPFNLVGLVFFGENFFIINCSDVTAVNYALSKKSPLNEFSNKKSAFSGYAGKELLDKLKDIAAKGFIPSVTSGDTGIGMTLEAELGITANSLAEPDYKGIELKASRRKRAGSKNRVTMFSKAPNWKLSPVKKAVNLINRRGYTDKDGRFSLYHTLNGKAPNSLGLQLLVDYKNDLLKQVYVKDGNTTHDSSWQLNDLRTSLRNKHPETFWVKANSKTINGVEHFHYTHATYTRSPKIDYLEMLIEDGVITLDYAMHLRSTGNGVRDHGYLFKILPSNFHTLFPEPIEYKLI